MEPSQDHTVPVHAPTFRPVGQFCPRCGEDNRVVDFGAQLLCGHCGRTWQADADILEVWVHELQRKPPRRAGAEEATLPGLVPLTTELPNPGNHTA